mgnify:CR=1 FL=1
MAWLQTLNKCPACYDTREYGGEPCVLCGGEHCHDPTDTGAAAVYTVIAVLIVVGFVLWVL